MKRREPEAVVLDDFTRGYLTGRVEAAWRAGYEAGYADASETPRCLIESPDRPEPRSRGNLHCPEGD